MSIIKGIFVYTLIFLGLVIGVGVILIGIMFFFPNVSVFGYSFYHGNNNGIIYEVVAEDETVVGLDNLIRLDGDILSNVDAIEINAGHWDIDVNMYDATGIENNVTYFRVEFGRAITGFVKSDSPEPSFTVTAERRALTGESEEKNVVTFTVIEPEGAYFNRGAGFHIWIPNTIDELTDLRINSGSGEITFSQVSIAELVPVGDPQISVANVLLNDDSGDATIRYVNILNDLTITADNSNFSIDRDLNCDITMNVNKGKYQFANIINTQGNAEVNIEAVNADIQFNNVQGNVTLMSDYGFFRAGTISGSFSALSHNTDDINNACDLRIGAIYGSTIIQNDSGNIEVGQIGTVESNPTGNDLRIDTKSGDVDIDNCFAKNIVITSTSGVINLDNCLGSLDVTSQNGSVYATYLTASDTVDGVSTAAIQTAVNALQNKPIKISTGVDRGNGAIEVYNTRGALTLESNGRGRIIAHIDYMPDKSQNVINAHNGNVDVIVPDDSRFWLDWRGVSSADLHIVDFETTEREQNSSMANYNADLNAVFMGGTADRTVSTKLTVDANRNLTIYSKIHADLQ